MSEHLVRNILICGNTGSGKSTSLRNLPLEKTIYINTEMKALPFKGSSRLKQSIKLSDPDEMIGGMDWIEEQDDVDYVVIDSISMLMDMWYMKHLATAPANKTMQMWGEYKNFGMEVIMKMKASKKFYIMTALMAESTDKFGIVDCQYAKVQGSLAKNIEAHFTVVAFTDTTEEKGKEPTYGLILKKTASRPLITGKSPFDFMDGKKVFDDNDLMVLVKEVEDYVVS
jgi:hypothetical protein